MVRNAGGPKGYDQAAIEPVTPRQMGSTMRIPFFIDVVSSDYGGRSNRPDAEQLFFTRILDEERVCIRNLCRGDGANFTV